MPADREHARTTGKPGCGRQPNAPLLALLVNSGLRRGEALALHWSDIDLDAKLLGVRGTLARVDAELVVTETKTAKSRRVVPLSPTAENVLHDVRTRQKAERRWLARCSSRPVRLHNRTGEPCDPRNALRALKAAATRAKLFRRLGCIRCGTPLPRSCCRPACRSRWSLRSSVTPASRSLETSTATSRLTCLVTH
jgi:integrase